MKVLFLVIASPGEDYDRMKSTWIRHWENAPESLRSQSSLRFLYGNSKIASSVPSRYDATYASVPESVVPGGLDKTMIAFAEALRENDRFDIFVRSNLSSVYLWDKLETFLGDFSMSDAEVAGFSDDRSHFSGCNIIFKRGAVRSLVNNDGELDRSDYDDVAMSKYLLASGFAHSFVPRLDIIDEGILLKNAAHDEFFFHVRFKTTNRKTDASRMDIVVDAWPHGTDNVLRLASKFSRA